jgi:hypothetical protein
VKAARAWLTGDLARSGLDLAGIDCARFNAQFDRDLCCSFYTSVRSVWDNVLPI